MKIIVVIFRDPGGVHVARCPSLPGCAASADTAEGAAEKMRQAVKSYLCSLDAPPPETIDFVHFDLNTETRR